MNLQGIRSISLPLFLSVVIVIIAMGGDSISLFLRYQSSLLVKDEYWRFITAHLVHLNWTHLMLNLLGLWVVWWLVGNALKQYQWALIILILAFTITLGLNLLSPAVEWYVGLSGILHGMLVVGLIVEIRSRPVVNLFILVMVIGKIILENTGVSLTAYMGLPVVADAHLYGVIVGVVSGLLLMLLRVNQK